MLLIGWSKLLAKQSISQIWVVTRHQYGISPYVHLTSFRGKTGGGLAKCRLLSQACHLFLQLLNSYKPVEVYWRIGIPKKVSNRVSKCTLLRIPYLKELIVIFLYKCRIYFFSLKIKFVMHAFDSWKLCKIIWKLLHIAYNLHHCCFWQEVNRNFNKNESPYTGLIYCESRTIFE